MVSEMLGHANISITFDTYSHVILGMGEAAAGAMDDASDRGPKEVAENSLLLPPT